MHRSLDDLLSLLPWILEAPRDGGEIRGLCFRPAVDERTEVEEAALTEAEGMAGDRWRATCRRLGEDGEPLADLQLTLMSSRVAEAVSGTRERWSLAGDQVFVDLDTSEENLPPGTRLRAGEAELEIVAEPHTGCGKFVARFGKDALVFVNGKERRSLRLRGVYARVVREGRVRVGDRMEKV